MRRGGGGGTESLNLIKHGHCALLILHGGESMSSHRTVSLSRTFKDSLCCSLAAGHKVSSCAILRTKKKNMATVLVEKSLIPFARLIQVLFIFCHCSPYSRCTTLTAHPTVAHTRQRYAVADTHLLHNIHKLVTA